MKQTFISLTIENSKKLIDKVKSLQEYNELLLVSEDAVPPEPSVARGSSENMEAQGPRKIKSRSKEKRVNKLSRKSKILTNANEISEAGREGRKHKRKGQPKKIVQDYTKFIDEEEETALDNYVAWVQCSKKKCGKWRRLEDSVDPVTLPEDWTCSQNPDPMYNMCDLPEEVWDGREKDIIYAELVPGSIVWAKQLGYPWWPGMVEHDPQTGKYFMFTSDSDQFPSKYHVTFFDTTVSHAWISVPLIKSFQDIPQEKSSARRDFTRRIGAAKRMAEEARKVKIQDRISHFGFVISYKRNGDAELSNDGSSQESLETPCVVQDAKGPRPGRKEEIWSQDSVVKEPAVKVAATRQLIAGKQKGAKRISAGSKRQREGESAVQLATKTFPNRCKRFRAPTMKMDSTVDHRKAAEEPAVSGGVEEPGVGPLEAGATGGKVTGCDRAQGSSCPKPDLFSVELSTAPDTSEDEPLDLRRGPPASRRGGPDSEDFAELLQEVLANKQDDDAFSDDDDVAILTSRKPEEKEEFAEFMFEE
ncbi:zinc finger CW-type PWWP domain protein 1-like [Scyliorhinus canicula]|uniref:zinc finger CW-type PWWP domain protein 1-like n=1 Tax=Scyliorhinus canicula TaxID=7830 RepID=UPI0018F4FD91|nr:zinc finger CW-type PWWP domain protein 1-like [Scyliorhinus canicula]